MSRRGRYVYIQVFNYGNQASQYRFYANYIHPARRVAAAALVTAFTCGSEDSNQNVSRATTVVGSFLQGRSFSGVTQDFIMNEITDEVKVQFGNGCMSELLINSTSTLIQGIFRNYF